MENRERQKLEIQSKVVQDWMNTIYDPPVPTFYAENEDFWKVMEEKEKIDLSVVEGFNTKPYDLIVRLDSRGRFVATVSTEREEICVWDVTK